MTEAVVWTVALFVFAVVKDAFLNRDSHVREHIILGPGLMALMAVTGCPLIAVVYVPYVFQVLLDWKRKYD